MKEKKSFGDAEVACRNRGKQLATIRNEHEDVVVHALLEESETDLVWAGKWRTSHLVLYGSKA